MTTSYVLATRNNNGSEVLLAQKNVIDFRRTLPARNKALHVFEHPGEYVIPGGEIRAGERPVESGFRGFCELMRLPSPGVARLRTFYESASDALFWLLPADENPWLTLSRDEEIQRLNNFYKERDAAVYLDEVTGRLVSGWPVESYGELHAMLWAPARRAEELLGSRGWLSDWQQAQYELVRHALPAYSNYRLLQIQHNSRMPSAESEDVLRYMTQNPLVTTVQVYKDYQRLSPMLREGSAGQVIKSHGEVRLLGRGLKFAEHPLHPLVGGSYFVVASNGPEVVLLRTMLYAGVGDDDTHMFVGKTSDADMDEPAGPRYDQNAEG